jgi:hypothetical protein
MRALGGNNGILEKKIGAVGENFAMLEKVFPSSKLIEV